jgi:HK97 family phage prohead protease
MNPNYKTFEAKVSPDDESGLLSAVFSTFGVIDKDGDVTEPTAFTDGQAVPLCWSHDWAKPIGRGVIKVDPDRAIFEGRFFLDTAAGREAYASVKAMGDLQEYSYGYRVEEAEMSEMNGQTVQILKKLLVFEVSPVLVGAGEGTRTLVVKTGQTLDDQTDAALAVVTDLIARYRSLADLRAKEGRAISAPRRARMSVIPGQLRGAADELDAILEETEPPKDAANDEQRIAKNRQAIAEAQITASRILAAVAL